ncbi:hypothetical protein SAMN02745163_02889 [Clostridium cavendishii DSM 21758]|uniref:Uncharacterized protein n=1 Tax=Clostridium cavendishii DSM 21758 TaxID=1121302 RepID=A0A1M6NF05_9CLOT|nr:hypothetical protein [Clostridium cavendishii]SHJ94328.1 hypothetical protein SAMN02745163_02889 [Clostridium cavendishii DSM 21758]
MKMIKKLIFSILIGIIVITFSQFNVKADESTKHVSGNVKKVINVGDSSVEIEVTNMELTEDGVQVYCSLTNNTDDSYILFKNNYYIIDRDKNDYSTCLNDDNRVTVRSGAKNEFTLKFKGVDIDKGPFILRGKANEKYTLFVGPEGGTDVSFTFSADTD